MKDYFLLFLILISYQIFTQNNRHDIRRLVTNKLSQTPLIGATFQIIGQLNGKSTATNNKGYYTLLDLPPGSYDLSVTYQGYNEGVIHNVGVV